MAETTADVRRDIELTRERMSATLTQLEQKLNIMQVVRDHPWPAIAVAVGAGVLLSGSRTDVKAAAATVAATRGASSKVGTVLDDVVAGLVGGLHEAFETRITSMVNDLKNAIGAPVQSSNTGPSNTAAGVADLNRPADVGGTSRSTAPGTASGATTGTGPYGTQPSTGSPQYTGRAD